jgi:hypothetical protein
MFYATAVHGLTNLVHAHARTRTLTHAHREQGPGEPPGAQQHVSIGTKPVFIHGHSQK